MKKHDADLDLRLKMRLDALTKPRSSLGRLEILAHRLGMIQNSLRPAIVCPHLLIFAGDHGIAAEGVSLYPQSVTAQMVRNFLAGGAAANVFGRVNDVELTVVDAGVATEITADDAAPCARGVRFVGASLGHGTANFLNGPAMTRDSVQEALDRGRRLVQELALRGTNTFLCGEMGIGNSSSAALITACLTGADLASCVGRGTGLSDSMYAHKVEMLRQALGCFTGDRTDPFAVAAAFGGFEIVMMAGAYLEAAAHQDVLLVDGFISSAALLLATCIAPATLSAAIFSHRSREPGHTLLLDHWHAAPLLDMELALGEGTGALLALPLLRAACAMLSDMATFESAAVNGPNARLELFP